MSDSYATDAEVLGKIHDGSSLPSSADLSTMRAEAKADIDMMLRSRGITQAEIDDLVADATGDDAGQVARVLRNCEAYHVLWHWFAGFPGDPGAADAAERFRRLYRDELDKLPQADESGQMVVATSGRLEVQ